MRSVVALFVLGCTSSPTEAAPAPDVRIEALRQARAACEARINDGPPIASWRDHARYAEQREAFLSWADTTDPALRLALQTTYGGCRDYEGLWALLDPEKPHEAFLAQCRADVTHDEAGCWARTLLHGACCAPSGGAYTSYCEGFREWACPDTPME